ncbi:hypothetical protein [Algirhabdus cladophorae]|uniref:hypothetical protein n=1 Tax=Algirhabdus cladophorae TaxID=3377108 RepID=UPI003B845FD4
MKDVIETPPQKALRPASHVMRLAQLGSMFPTRLSFLRSLMRRLKAENAQVSRPVWNICANGFGHAVYSVELGGHTYSLVAVSTDIPADQRSDRVIATAWDAAFCLFDGVPGPDDIARICKNAPKQEAGQFSEKELVLSRANKSVRLFNAVVAALQSGTVPDEAMIRDIGYLMRTTAVYGNGKFGIADRALIQSRPCLGGPFAAEMLTVWLIRGFTHDLVEHVGQGTLPRHVKVHLGIGNSTGLGMAPFLVSHPTLLNNWMMARETALARVRAIETLDEAQIERIWQLILRAQDHIAQWRVPDPAHQSRIEELDSDFAEFCLFYLDPRKLREPFALDAVMMAAQTHSADLEELVAALLIEPFEDLVDGLTDCMVDPFGSFIDPRESCGQLWVKIRRDWGWAQKIDFDSHSETAQFWYVSEEKLEPRLGLRHSEDGADLESPLDIARRVQDLARDLPFDGTSLAEFLRAHPQHRFAAERIQNLARNPYAEIHDNLIGEGCLPIDMLRCKLSFFGASKFDPKSDRWTRITLCQGAPLFNDYAEADDWWLPAFEA